MKTHLRHDLRRTIRSTSGRIARLGVVSSIAMVGLLVLPGIANAQSAVAPPVPVPGPSLPTGASTLNSSSSISAVGDIAVALFGPNGSYLTDPNYAAQVVRLWDELPAPAQQTIEAEVLQPTSSSTTTTPGGSSVGAPSAAGMVSPASSWCGTWGLNTSWTDSVGFTLVKWRVTTYACGNGGSLWNQSFYPTIIETSWGWAFSNYTTDHGQFYGPGEFQDVIGAQFTVGFRGVGLSNQSILTTSIYANNNGYGNCSGPNGHTCYWGAA